MSDPVIEHLMDIKERLVRVETKLDDHTKECAERDALVKKLEVDMIKSKATTKTMKWMAGIIFVTIPATAAAIVKILNP